MNRITSLIAFAFLVALLTCCRDEPKRIPSTLPDVHGYIKSIKKTADSEKIETAVVLIQSMEGVDPDYGQASIKIDKSTLLEDETGKAMEVDQLREGHEVEAWLEGNVLQAPPVQGTAKAIRVKQ